LKSYLIVYFDSTGARGVRSFTIHRILFPVVFIFTLAAVICFLFSFFLVLNAGREIFILRGKDSMYFTEKNIMNESASKLEKSVNSLQQGTFFAQEVFDVPVVSSAFNYDEFISGFDRADLLTELAQIENKNTYKAIPKLLRIIDSIGFEADKRRELYVKLFEYLEEQNVIFSHTPSIWPINKQAISVFGFRRSPITGVPSYHEGVDFPALIGTNIRSSADGVVVFAGVRSGYGYLVTIDHGFGYMTRYAHNSRILAKEGDYVKKGDIIALSGSTGRSTGAHLHYEVLYHGCPVNSFKFLPKN
jgi:murein DD-endopeptidase MepM/ murein hydrolase activator NlpD